MKGGNMKTRSYMSRLNKLTPMLAQCHNNIQVQLIEVPHENYISVR